LARFLQDVSGDDSDDAAIDEDGRGWVVRRTVVEVRRAAVLGASVDLVTWCSGIGSRWAERRVTLRAAEGGHVEAATLWVYVDIATGRPSRLPPRFDEFFAESAAGRRVTARLRHPPPPPNGASARRWPLRFCDFDVLGHVNNASYWEAVEEELADRRRLRAPVRAELEYGAGINLGAAVDILAVDEPDDGLAVWLVADGVVAASARLYTIR